jgi:O-succinylbenzoate synthase
MMTGQVPQPLRSHVPVNAILPDVAPQELAQLTRRAAREHGCRTVKLKVGAHDPDLDVRRVRAVRHALDDVLGEAWGRIRIDANGRWTPARAIAALTSLREFGIDYVEQPCRSLAEIAAVRAADTGVAIAVDEVLRRDRQFVGLAAVADVAVLKVAPLGGGRAVLALAQSLDVPVVISSALESSVGLSRDARVAAALPRPPLDCGLGTGALLAADVVADTLLPRDARVAVDPRQPDPGKLAAAALPDASAWLDRVDRAWEAALAGGLMPADQVARLREAA